MRNFFLILLGMLFLIETTSCSNSNEPTIVSKSSVLTSQNYSTSEIATIAKNALRKFGIARDSRSESKVSISVYHSNNSRSQTNDTTLFIANFENGGFAIIAANRNIPNPVFAVGEGEFVCSPDNGTSDYMEAANEYLSYAKPTYPPKRDSIGVVPLKPFDDIQQMQHI